MLSIRASACLRGVPWHQALIITQLSCIVIQVGMPYASSPPQGSSPPYGGHAGPPIAGGYGQQVPHTGSCSMSSWPSTSSCRTHALGCSLWGAPTFCDGRLGDSSCALQASYGVPVASASPTRRPQSPRVSNGWAPKQPTLQQVLECIVTRPSGQPLTIHSCVGCHPQVSWFADMTFACVYLSKQAVLPSAVRQPAVDAVAPQRSTGSGFIESAAGGSAAGGSTAGCLSTAAAAAAAGASGSPGAGSLCSQPGGAAGQLSAGIQHALPQHRCKTMPACPAYSPQHGAAPLFARHCLPT
jgi:hypothetical protein